MAVSFLGKLKTISQMAAIPLLLYHDKIGENFDPQEIGTWLIYLAAILTLWSMAYYLKVAIPQALKHGYWFKHLFGLHKHCGYKLP